MNKVIIIDGVDVSECKHLYIPQETKICQCLICETGEFVQCKREVYCYFKQLQRLKKEKEELKEYYKGFVANCRYCDEWYMDKCNYIKKDNNYKQALEEIKKWVTNHNPCDIEADINCTEEDCFKCLSYDIKKITRIINEVLK